MPIYEFYCDQCHMLFNFLSRRINTSARPDCPKCGKADLQRQMSQFATIGKAEEKQDDPMAGIDETKMEHAFESLMSEARGMDDNDPRQMALLMRSFTDRTGIEIGDSMQEAMARMEAGEDPEQVEQEMGDLLDGDDVFSLEGLRKKVVAGKQRPPLQDQKLYELQERL